MAIVETIRDSQAELATREDLLATRRELKAEIVKQGLELRNEFHTAISALRDEFRGELHSEIGGLRKEMQEQLSTLLWRILLGVGVIVSVVGGIVGIVFTLVGGK